MMTETEIAWLAGLLEGEGCFTLANKKTGQPAVTINMTDRDVIERAAALMGAKNVLIKKREKPHWKTAFVAQIRGYKAEKVMSIVLPHMGARRSSKIIENIRLWNGKAR